jgi:hypothetical protein
LNLLLPKVALDSETKGYRFRLTSPVSVTVLVRGNAKNFKRMVPLAGVP